MRTDTSARFEAIADEMFDKKVEDLDEFEVREVWEMEALFRADGRAGPLAHVRLSSWDARRRVSST